MKAAAGGRGYHINYGGSVTYNHAADVARALVAMSRTPFTGSAVFNMPGTVAHMSEVVAAIEAAAPDVAGEITFDDVQLPLPPEMATGGLAAAIGDVVVTPLAEGVRQTVEHYRRTAA
jgi:nucleoside-diphosphate-sugar epimerase